MVDAGEVGVKLRVDDNELKAALSRMGAAPEQSERRRERNDDRRHRETGRLLRSAIVGGLVATVAAGALQPFQKVASGLGQALAAPLVPALNAVAANVLDPAIQTLGFLLGGERPQFEARPGSALERARDRFRRFAPHTRPTGEATLGSRVLEFGGAIGIGIFTAGETLYQRATGGRDPDQTYTNPQQGRASSPYGGG